MDCRNLAGMHHRPGVDIGLHRFKSERKVLRKQGQPSTNDQIKGALHEVKGAVKAKVGQAANNPTLEAEGHDERLTGKVQRKVGQIEKVFEK